MRLGETGKGCARLGGAVALGIACRFLVISNFAKPHTLKMAGLIATGIAGTALWLNSVIDAYKHKSENIYNYSKL